MKGGTMKVLSLVAAALLLAVAGPAGAQDQSEAAAAGSSDLLGEVIVSARKRDESIQQVPIAVTALSGEDLVNERVTDVMGLATHVPSLVIVPGNGASRSIPVFSIRGLSQQELTILADPSVTTYFGDIVYSRAQGINAAMFDIGRVEVAKGPQGTLFGRNVTGGAILIKPNAPTEAFEASVGVTVGNLDTREGNLMVNLPLDDRAQLRIAGAFARNEGYVEDVLSGDFIDETDWYGYRASLALQPTDSVDSTFVFNGYREMGGTTPAFVNQINMDSPPAPGGAPGSLSVLCGAGPTFLGWGSCQELAADQQARGIYETASGVGPYSEARTWDIANTTTFDISEDLAFKSILGYRSVDSHTLQDTDGTPWPVLHIERIDDLQQRSAELQLLGNNDRLEWIVGAYYFNETGENQGISVTAATEPPPTGGTNLSPEPPPHSYPAWSNTNVEGDNTSYAGFVQGTFRLGERFSITAGGRYTKDEREAAIKNHLGTTGGVATACRFTVDDDENPATPEVNPGIAGCNLPLEAEFSEPTWTLSFEYDKLIYLAHRRGYRSGGFGARAGTEVGLEQTFEPETVSDIELGAKIDWTSALRTNLAIFYSDYDDIQRLLTDTTTTPVTTVTTNAGKAEIRGGELEFTWFPIDSLELSGWYSYTDAEFTEFTNPFNGQDLSGAPFARAPENMGSFSARWQLPLAATAGTFNVGASYWFTDDYSSNDDFHPTVMIDGYELVNAYVDWAGVFGSKLDIGLFCNNVTDEEYNLAVLNIYTSLGFDARMPGEPQTYGVTLTYHFD
jgi:iron complex outermembrane recepter protein